MMRIDPSFTTAEQSSVVKQTSTYASSNEETQPLIVRHSHGANEPSVVAHPLKDLSTTTKVIILSTLLLGGAIAYHWYLRHTQPDKPPIPPDQQDPHLFDEKHCKRLMDVWNSIKPSVVHCPKDQPLSERVGSRFYCFDEERYFLEKFASRCNINISELEKEIPSDIKLATPVMTNKYTMAENDFIIERRYKNLLNFVHNPNRYVPECGDLDETALDPKEIQAIKAINNEYWVHRWLYSPSFKYNQEYVRHDALDSRNKSFFFSTEAAAGRALDPEVYADLLQGLNKETDLKYEALGSNTDRECESIGSYTEICHQIYVSSTIGKISDIYIQADKDRLLHREEILGYQIPDRSNPFSECYVEGYAAEKAKVQWLD